MGAFVENPRPENAGQLRSAFNYLKSALALLDASNAPAQIGAHVDLAINFLEAAFPVKGEGENYPMDTNADPQ